MSLWDYVLPWKAIPNMVKDVKDAASYKGDNKHASIFGAIGKYADPAGALMGDNWMNFWHGTVPEQVNQSLEPVGAFHRKYLDPIAMAMPEDSKWQGVPDFAQAKGGDTAAAITGMVLGGMALGGAGGGAGGNGGGGFFQNPYANMDWSDPQTYMRMAQSMPQQQQQQSPPQYQPTGLLSPPQDEYERRLEELRRYGIEGPRGLLG